MTETIKIVGCESSVFLRPGEFYFGRAPCQIKTLLGSCVAITLWHPRHKIGGMCHYMLTNPAPQRKRKGILDGRYAEDAVQLFLNALVQTGTRPQEYQVKVFGGGNMFPHILKSGQNNNISEKNVEVADNLLKSNGFSVQASHLGGAGYRRIVFDISSGVVQVFHQPYHDKPFNGTM